MTAFNFAQFLLEVSRGNVPGHSLVEKFGSDTAIGTSLVTIWPPATLYVYSNTANIDSISSSNAGDTEAIQVEGLDENWNPVTQQVTLTGQTTATLSTPLIRVTTMYNAGSTDLVGTTYLYVNGAAITAGVPDSTGDIRAEIVIGEERTVQCVYTIPAGFDGYVIHRDTSAAQGKDVTFVLKVRPFGQTFQTRHTLLYPL